MLSLQRKLARMQSDLDALTGNVVCCSEKQVSVNSQLSSAQVGLDELLEEEARADSVLAGARKEFQQAKSDLEVAKTNISHALLQPAPFLCAAPKGIEVACAVVATLKGIPEPELQTWLAHHINGCGFHIAFLFFDDPAECSQSAHTLRQWSGRVVGTPVDDNLLHVEYERCARRPALASRMQEDWLARQELHAEIATRWARAQGCQWLLHIDLDELFVLDGRSAPQHFASIPAELNTTAYLNHEGVPELHNSALVSALTENRFEAVTLFRRNPHCFEEGCGLDDIRPDIGDLGSCTDRTASWQSRLAAIAAEDVSGISELGTCRSPRHVATRRAFKFWLRRSKAELGIPQYFLAYVNGKGAVRLKSSDLPNGVHRFGCDEARQYWSPTEVAIFHYAHSSFEALAEKMQRLRASSGTWWKPFALNAIGRGLDSSELQSIYQGSVALCCAEAAACQVSAGVCLRYRVNYLHLPKWQLGCMD